MLLESMEANLLASLHANGVSLIFMLPVDRNPPWFSNWREASLYLPISKDDRALPSASPTNQTASKPFALDWSIWSIVKVQYERELEMCFNLNESIVFYLLLADQWTANVDGVRGCHSGIDIEWLKHSDTLESDL